MFGWSTGAIFAVAARLFAFKIEREKGCRFPIGAVAREKTGLLNYSCTEQTRDGRSVIIRAIRPDDKGGLIDALNKVSPQSLYWRLFSGKRKFSDEEMVG